MGFDVAREMSSPPAGAPAINFRLPPGEPALAPAGGVTWRVFKNPLSLFIGGISAVLLELAEPRVRTGVWEHTTFRTDPIGRMRRTGYAAMVTVYGPRAAAERMIAGISRMHARVSGATPGGAPYRADDPELLDWVQATASFGFLEAYGQFARPLSQAERDAFFAEGAAAARLYGATGAPGSEADWEAQLARMAPKLEAHPIVDEFLQIVRRAPIAPWPLGIVQMMGIRAAIEILPARVQEILSLERAGLKFGERTLLRWMGALAERVPIPETPAAQACARMGLPVSALYR